MKKSSFFLLLIILSIQGISQTINVTNSTELLDALSNAIPGQTISMADGLYVRSGGFYVNAGINGTVSQPITLKGSKNAILSTGSTTSSYGFALKGNDYWIIDGFTVYDCKKGIVLDESNHNTLQNLTVNKIGEEAIHLRTYSSYNTIYNCFIDTCGLESPGTGEGIYIGSANSNWSTYTGGNPDTCNYNLVDYCSFGEAVASENIDIKEGTNHGKITNCSFNGKGLSGVNSADSWIDVKGNYYEVGCNSGINTLLNGIETHINYAGFGDFNSFYSNSLNVPSTGYGIKVQTSGSKGTANGNEVCSSNSVNSDALGLSNVTTSSCTYNCIVTYIEEYQSTQFSIFPNPSTGIIQWDNAVSFQLFDLLGNLLVEGIGNHCDLSYLPRSMYVILINGSNHHILLQ